MYAQMWELLRAYKRPIIAFSLAWKLLLLVYVLTFFVHLELIHPSDDCATKSNVELRAMEPTAQNRTPLDATILIYNRVPKSGSTTLKTLLFELGHDRGFIHRSSREFFSRQLSPRQEKMFVEDLINESQQFQFPFSFDRHIYFVNVSSYTKSVRPAYINLLRDPASRAASLFYFSRMERELRRSLRTTYGRALHNDSGWTDDVFGECVLQGRPECLLHPDAPAETSVTYFCGSAPECLELNNQAALQRAKMTLEMEYSVVGVLERMEDSLKVMEAYVPAFLKGISRAYRKESSVRRLGNPSQHPPPAAEALQVLRRELKTEYDLYHFAEQRLMKQLKAISVLR